MRRHNFHIDSGDLREPLYCQVLQSVGDDGGGSETRWVDSFEFYGRLSPNPSVARWGHLRIEEVLTHEIETRYDSGLSTKNRIRMDGRYFKVHGVIDLENRGRRMLLACTETTKERD